MSSKFDPSEIQQNLQERLPEYNQIRDCISGSTAIKKAGVRYLPVPDLEDDNVTRYSDYLLRAVFYNITGSTVNSMVGMAFGKEIKSLEIPASLAFLEHNIDGSGVNIVQQMKKTLASVVSIGRAGLLIDHSKDAAETQHDVITGKVRPSVLLFPAEDIVWVETSEVGAVNKLSLVILKDSFTTQAEDGYKTKSSEQYRVLLLDSGVYYQEVWRHSGNTNEWLMVEDGSSTPTDSTGKTFDHIPFTFVGSENNDHTIDEPPMLAISDLNIGHYRNSADSEESIFMSSQATPVAAGLTKSWVKDVLKGTLRLGARGGILLPEGATASLLQSKDTSAATNAMAAKEKQAAAIGAQLVTDTTGRKTATEIDRNSSVENSNLSGMVENVEQAYRFCFEQIELFTGITGFELELTKDFTNTMFSPETYLALVNGTLQGVSQKEDVFNYLRTTNMVNFELTYDDWLKNIEMTIPSEIVQQ